MSTARHNPHPYRPVAPGEILYEELAARSWTREELAIRLGYRPETIGELLHGRKAITADMALALSDVFGTSAEFWMNLEVAYRLALARRRRRAG